MSDQYLYKCSKCCHSICTDDHGCECTSGGISYLYYCEVCHILAERITPPLSGKIDAYDVRWYCEGRDVTPIRLRVNSSITEAVIDENRTLNNVRCPLCASRNIHKWNPIFGGCPRCGGKMIKEDGFCIHSD